MADIVERRGLRGPRCCVECQDDCGEAADEIERLKSLCVSYSGWIEKWKPERQSLLAEIERLRGALELLATGAPAAAGHANPMALKNWMREIARAALDHGLPTAEDVRGILREDG